MSGNTFDLRHEEKAQMGGKQRRRKSKPDREESNFLEGRLVYRVLTAYLMPNNLLQLPKPGLTWTTWRVFFVSKLSCLENPGQSDHHMRLMLPVKS
eukprot:1161570-Pelagomonas_calceolata.AAC.3